MKRTRRLTWYTVSVLCGLMLAAQSAEADNIVFNDLTDSLTVTIAPASSRLSGVCTAVPEFCQATLTAPAGYTFTEARTFAGASFGNLPTQKSQITIAEPGTNLVSDELDPLTGFTAGSTTVTFKFLSDTELGLGLCPVAGCDLIENGLTQLAFRIAWDKPNSTQIIDNIGFRSDVEVPEPSSLMLLLAGLVGAAAPVCRRRNRVSRDSEAFA